MPTQVQRTASARRRLIAAATTLVAEQGVGNTSVAAIGERAGMSRGAVNFHFGSKDDLLTAVAEEVTADWEARAFRFDLSSDAPISEGLPELLRAHLRDMSGADNNDRFRIFAMLFFEALGPSPHLHEHFARLHRRVRARMVELLDGLESTGAISSDFDKEAFVAVVIGAFRGLTFQKLLDPDNVDLDRAYAEMGQMLLTRLER